MLDRMPPSGIRLLPGGLPSRRRLAAVGWFAERVRRTPPRAVDALRHIFSFSLMACRFHTIAATTAPRTPPGGRARRRAPVARAIGFPHETRGRATAGPDAICAHGATLDAGRRNSCFQTQRRARSSIPTFFLQKDGIRPAHRRPARRFRNETLIRECAPEWAGASAYPGRFVRPTARRDAGGSCRATRAKSAEGTACGHRAEFAVSRHGARNRQEFEISLEIQTFNTI
ncbi:hypothetical protein G3N57_26380 [Paraburkholderia sp. Se-20369]|nr:hypothetical protein [Paraburkholderia sp. Se-20369]